MSSPTSFTLSPSLPVDRAAVDAAYEIVAPVVRRTPLEFSARLSDETGAQVYLKREDLQTAVRSYKIRGAYHRMSRLTAPERAAGIVCASAGNHAQGVALSCRLLGVEGVIFMPQNTPRQKVQRVIALGGDKVRLQMVGDTFDQAKTHAAAFADAHGSTIVPPFDDPDVIAGQGTVTREIFEQLAQAGVAAPDFLVLPVGGGGLLSGAAAYLGVGASEPSPTQLIAAEPSGAASLYAALEAGEVVILPSIDTFVDGAAVGAIGTNTFAIAQAARNAGILLPIVRIGEGRICTAMIGLYQSDGIIAEPAGALSVAALTDPTVLGAVRGRTVVCVVSGGNNDISRYPEVIERSLIDRGLKHYFLIEFAQRAGALRQYLDEALGPHDDVTLFEYVKKNNREFGPTLVGIELTDRTDLAPLLERMDGIGLRYQTVEQGSVLHRFLV